MKISFTFQDAKQSSKLDEYTRALVKLKDGNYTIATYEGSKYGWHEENIDCYGNITDKVVLFSILK